MAFYRFTAYYQFMDPAEDSGDQISKEFEIVAESADIENEINAWRKVTLDAVCWAYDQDRDAMIQLHKIELMEVND